MPLVTQLQYGLLLGYTALLLAAVVIGWKRRAARPWAFAAVVLAVVHVAFYVELLFINLLSFDDTMILSIVARYMVLFLAVFVFAMAVIRESWRD